nr:MAG TPA: Protein recA [Caudoviricetes sp.]
MILITCLPFIQKIIMAGRKKIKIPTLREIQKKFPSQYIAGEVDESKRPWLPTRFLAFNKVTGGGCPFGKIIELFGEESSGKSLMAYDFAYCCQYLGGMVLWVDAEQSFTNSWAEKNGLDLNKIVVYRSTSIEAISDWVANMALYWRNQLTHNEPILLVLDSISALDTDINLNSEMLNASADMGNRAKAIYKYFRIRNEMLYSLGITQVYINQLRKNLKAGMFENPDTTPGGKALAFYASIRIGLYGGKQITKKIKGKERKIGRVTSIRTIKNKVATPGPTLKGTPLYNNAKYVDSIGFDRLHFLDEILIEEEIIEKSKSGTYSYKGKTLCRGAEKFADLLKEDDNLRRKLIRKAGINTLGSTKKLLESISENLYPIDGINSDEYDDDDTTEDE